MAEATLTSDQILVAAEDVLRRYGPAKATVVDVASALGVNHGSVYRHFPSKAALRDAVTARWLERTIAPLAAIAAETGAASERLHRWLEALRAGKRRKVLDDPELFTAYLLLAAEDCRCVETYVASLNAQVTQIITDGQAQGEFASSDPAATARAVLNATSRFHDPAHASEWADPGADTAFEGVWSLLLGGLTHAADWETRV